MEKIELKNGAMVCILDHKGMPFCNARIISADSWMGKNFAVLDGVDEPVHHKDLRAATKGYRELVPAK